MPQGPFHWPHSWGRCTSYSSTVWWNRWTVQSDQLLNAPLWSRWQGGHNRKYMYLILIDTPHPVLYRPLAEHLYQDPIPTTLCLSCVCSSLQASPSFWTFWGKSEACRERMCEWEGREKEILATDLTRVQATQLATLTEDRFLWLWEIKHCLLCGFFQRINLETLIPHVGTKDLFKASKQKILV